MIKFFRKIRRDLMEQNKTGRYLKYAIGEIILVVIGILIALQINNWNEQRKLNATEVNVLKQLKFDLEANLNEIESLVSSFNRYNQAGKNILTHLDSDEGVTDSLKLWVETFEGLSIFNNANATYKNIQNSNQSIISNDSLRLAITLIYELDFENIHMREKRTESNQYRVYKDEKRKNFKAGTPVSNWLEGMELSVNTPFDINELKQSEYYKSALLELYNYRLLRIRRLKETIFRLDKLLKEIDQEIVNLSK